MIAVKTAIVAAGASLAAEMRRREPLGPVRLLYLERGCRRSRYSDTKTSFFVGLPSRRYSDLPTPTWRLYVSLRHGLIRSTHIAELVRRSLDRTKDRLDAPSPCRLPRPTSCAARSFSELGSAHYIYALPQPSNCEWELVMACPDFVPGRADADRSGSYRAAKKEMRMQQNPDPNFAPQSGRAVTANRSERPRQATGGMPVVTSVLDG
jgi:hypothetical protein